METLLFSLKFFFKITVLALATYLGAENPNIAKDQAKENTVEFQESKPIKQNMDEKIFVIDSLNNSLNKNIKKNLLLDNV